MSKKGSTVNVFERGNVNYLPWTCVKNKKQRYIHDLLDVINNHIKLQLNQRRNKKFQFKKIQLRSLKVVWMGKAKWVLPSRKIEIILFIASEKLTMLVFFWYWHLAGLKLITKKSLNPPPPPIHMYAHTWKEKSAMGSSK